MQSQSIKKIGIAIVDDHSLFRDAVSSFLKNFNESNKEYVFNVVLEAENGEDFIKKSTLLHRSNKIDIIILDVNMPFMGGFETLKWIKKNFIETKVLMLTMYDDAETVASFMKEGANGYITKTTPKEIFEKALRSITEHGFFYDDFTTQKLIEVLKKINYTRDEYQSKQILATTLLSEREREFIKLLASELTYKEIAEKMDLSVRTIDGYREVLFKKLDVKTRSGLILKAIKDGILNIMPVYE